MKRNKVLISEIRNYVNEKNLYESFFKSRIDEWNKICVSMDTFEDSCLALSYYENSSSGLNEGEKYLRLYGMLQAIILQQDAISTLYKIFLNNTLMKKKNSSWLVIRNLRNLTVGHPIEKTSGGRGTKRCFISRITLGDSGFQLIIWNKDSEKNNHENIDLVYIYENYKDDAISHLKEIKQAIENNW